MKLGKAVYKPTRGVLIDREERRIDDKEIIDLLMKGQVYKPMMKVRKDYAIDFRTNRTLSISMKVVRTIHSHPTVKLPKQQQQSLPCNFISSFLDWRTVRLIPPANPTVIS